MRVDQVIEQQCNLSSSSIALTFENESYSYSQLKKHTDSLTKTINQTLSLHNTFNKYNSSNNIDKNVQPRVCVIMERHAGLVITLLSVWKANACYVPIDPSYPVDRQAYIFKDCQAHLIVTDQQSVVDDLRSHNVMIILVSNTGEYLQSFNNNRVHQAHLMDNANDTDRPPTEDHDSSLAYILYTSGSTGNPKGVMVGHKTVLNTLCHFQEEFQIGKGDHWLAVTTFCFDISVLELFLPLISGAKLVVASLASQKNGQKLTSLIVNEKINFMQATPATFKMMKGQHSNWLSHGLTLICGGEAFPSSLLDLIPQVKAMYNVYGPTEATIWCSAYKFPSQMDYQNNYRAIPIGKAIQNVKFSVLDKNLAQVKDGEIGELYISGQDCLAQGYWNRPDLTKRVFIPNPDSTEYNAKMYKTSDLVRRLNTGDLEFISRANEDAQVKLRGYRIELGEIVFNLEQHPLINTALVTIEEMEDFGFQSVLVANVVCNSYQLSHNKMETDLKAYMKRKLPKYMNPAIYRFLSEFPLTPNGKIDKNLLKNHQVKLDDFKLQPNITIKETPSCKLPLYTERRDLEMGESPNNQVLNSICQMVTETSGAEVDGSSSLMSIGIDSLASIQFLNRLNRMFKVSLTLSDIMKQENVFALAKLVSERSLFNLPANTTAASTSSDKVPLITEKESQCETSKNGSNGFLQRNYASLQGMRGVLILWVYAAHYMPFEWEDYFGFRVHFNVNVFFILGGFTIFLQLYQQEQQQLCQKNSFFQKYKRFVYSKAISLFPIYYLAMIPQIPYYLNWTLNSQNYLHFKTQLPERDYSTWTTYAWDWGLYLTGMQCWCPLTFNAMDDLWFISHYWNLFLVAPFLFKLVMYLSDTHSSQWSASNYFSENNQSRIQILVCFLVVLIVNMLLNFYVTMKYMLPIMSVPLFFLGMLAAQLLLLYESSLRYTSPSSFPSCSLPSQEKSKNQLVTFVRTLYKKVTQKSWRNFLVYSCLLFALAVCVPFPSFYFKESLSKVTTTNMKNEKFSSLIIHSSTLLSLNLIVENAIVYFMLPILSCMVIIGMLNSSRNPIFESAILTNIGQISMEIYLFHKAIGDVYLNMLVQGNYNIPFRIDLGWLHDEPMAMKFTCLCLIFCISWIVNHYYTNSMALKIVDFVRRLLK